MVTFPTTWLEGVFLGCWISVSATAASVYLVRELRRPWALALSVNVGFWASAVVSLSGSRLDLLKALPCVAIAPDGTVIDLHDELQLGQTEKDADFRLERPGAYLLVLQTDNNAQTHLPSIRFNDYLRVEGLTPALEQRTRLHQMDTDGSERYSRCAKSIVQVGPSNAASSSQVTKPVGLPLEIVPEANPYSVPRRSTLPTRVIYQGRTLAGALVKLTDLTNDASPFEVHLTNSDGRATFTLPDSGSWLLNVIWTMAQPAADEVDFETVFSSLSFGFPADQQEADTRP